MSTSVITDTGEVSIYISSRYISLLDVPDQKKITLGLNHSWRRLTVCFNIDQCLISYSKHDLLLSQIGDNSLSKVSRFHSKTTVFYSVGFWCYTWSVRIQYHIYMNMIRNVVFLIRVAVYV